MSRGSTSMTSSRSSSTDGTGTICRGCSTNATTRTSGISRRGSECGNTAHGMMVEDDPYFDPLDEDGNYVDGAFGRCC